MLQIASVWYHLQLNDSMKKVSFYTFTKRYLYEKGIFSIPPEKLSLAGCLWDWPSLSKSAKEHDIRWWRTRHQMIKNITSDDGEHDIRWWRTWWHQNEEYDSVSKEALMWQIREGLHRPEFTWYVIEYIWVG